PTRSPRKSSPRTAPGSNRPTASPPRKMAKKRSELLLSRSRACPLPSFTKEGGDAETRAPKLESRLQPESPISGSSWDSNALAHRAEAEAEVQAIDDPP